MAGKLQGNALLKDHVFEFDECVEVERRFPNRTTARNVALRLRRAGFDCKMAGATLVMSLPSTLALSAKVFGDFS